MKLVRENISFKRGIEPSKALDIGRVKERKAKEEIKKLRAEYKYLKSRILNQYYDMRDVPDNVKYGLHKISKRIRELQWEIDPDKEADKEKKDRDRKISKMKENDKKLKLIKKEIIKEYPKIREAIKIFDNSKYIKYDPKLKKKVAKLLDASDFKNITEVKYYVQDARAFATRLKKQNKVTGHLSF